MIHSSPLMDHLAVIIATGFFSGMLPIAPGVWGAIIALLPSYYGRNLPQSIYIGMTIAIFLIGYFAAAHAEMILAQKDASPIVIDEILGVFITLAVAPKHRANWLAGLLIFLIFDGLKPFPATWIDTHLAGGLGIMLDDVVAGTYALICLYCISFVTKK